MLKSFYIILLFNASYTLAQNPVFPIDNSGKYIFSDVIIVSGVNQDDLFEKGEEFIQQLKIHNSTKNNLRKNHAEFTLFNKGSLVVHNYGAVKNSISGVVEFDMALEFKDGKCRYTITNFIFNPYKRNRYGKFESISGKYTPLEKEISKLNKKAWAKHRREVYDYSQDLIKSLTEKITYKEITQPQKIIKSDNW